MSLEDPLKGSNAVRHVGVAPHSPAPRLRGPWGPLFFAGADGDLHAFERTYVSAARG